VRPKPSFSQARQFRSKATLVLLADALFILPIVAHIVAATDGSSWDSWRPVVIISAFSLIAVGCSTRWLSLAIGRVADSPRPLSWHELAGLNEWLFRLSLVLLVPMLAFVIVALVSGVTWSESSLSYLFGFAAIGFVILGCQVGLVSGKSEEFARRERTTPAI
jgi:hypothetical protein